MSAGDRRRLTHLAKEYVRPGMHVRDLHASLDAIQRQRILWQRFVAQGVTPEVPTGIAEVQAAWTQVAADLESLDAPLGRVTRETSLRRAAVARARSKRSAGWPRNPTR